MGNLFVVILSYKVSLEVIDTYKEEHLNFLDKFYENGNFIFSGPQAPRKGGIILTRSKNKASLEEVLSKDPFAINKLAEYQIYEFTPTKGLDGFIENALIK